MIKKDELLKVLKRYKGIEEQLYNYTPPSLTWKKKVDFIKAKHNKYWKLVWAYYVSKTMKKRFNSIRVKNVEALYNCNPDYPTIFIAQHTNWFDGMLAWVMCDEMLKLKMNIMVEDLAKFPLLSQVGAFSISKKSPKTMVKVLNYCVDFLTKKEAVLYIFPQGIIKPPGYRPLEFNSGVSYIALKTKRVNIVMVSPKYTYLRQGMPEILVDFSEPIIIDENNTFKDKETLTGYLETEYEKLLDNQEKTIANGNIEEYSIYYKKPDGNCKRIEKWAKSRF